MVIHSQRISNCTTGTGTGAGAVFHPRHTRPYQSFCPGLAFPEADGSKLGLTY